MPVLYPFYQSRLQSVPLQGSPDMSIVFLQGGGLSKEQLDSLPLGPSTWTIMLSRWTAKLFQRHDRTS
jgi:hypothetical protein